MQVISFLIKIIKLVSGIVSKIYKYKTLFVFTGLVATRRFKPAKKNHKYAILIAARNEY